MKAVNRLPTCADHQPPFTSPTLSAPLLINTARRPVPISALTFALY
ncbi:MAG: hypothetical protein HDT47_03230 [Ruminococcaceae bacterium]|nr:hypothetical protein [Oscillospiraceae bacterium]